MSRFKIKNIKNVDEILFVLLIVILAIKIENLTQVILLILSTFLWWDKELTIDKSKNLLLLMTGGFFSVVFIKNYGINVEWMLFLLILILNFINNKKMIKTIYFVPIIAFFNHNQMILSGVIIALLMIFSTRKDVVIK